MSASRLSVAMVVRLVDTLALMRRGFTRRTATFEADREDLRELVDTFVPNGRRWTVARWRTPRQVRRGIARLQAALRRLRPRCVRYRVDAQQRVVRRDDKSKGGVA